MMFTTTENNRLFINKTTTNVKIILHDMYMYLMCFHLSNKTDYCS